MTFTIRTYRNDNNDVWAALLLCALCAGSLLTLFIPGTVMAQESSPQAFGSPQSSLLHVKAWNLEAAYDPQSRVIDGAFNLQNLSNVFGHDIRVVAQILSLDKKEIVDEETLPQAFKIAPEEITKKAFRYTLQLTPKGTYKLRIKLIEGTGRKLEWMDTAMVFPEGKEFLALYNQHVEAQGIAFGAQEGPVLSPNTPGTFVVFVSNPTDHPLEVTPVLEVREREPSNALIKRWEAREEYFAPQETAQRSYAIAQIEEPGVYIATLSYRSKDGQRLSGIAQFRWIVPGPAARILSVSTENDPDGGPEDFIIHAAVTGPPDFSILKDAVFTTTLTNAEGKKFFKDKFALPVLQLVQTHTLTIPVHPRPSTSNAPRVLHTTITDEQDKVLSSYQVTLPFTQAKSFWHLQRGFFSRWFLLIMVGMGGAGFLLWRTGSGKGFLRAPVAIFILTILIGLASLYPWRVDLTPKAQAFSFFFWYFCPGYLQHESVL